MSKLRKSSSSVNETMLNEARRRGKRDGKNEVPRQDWGAGSVPYLGQLNKQFIALASSMILKFEQLHWHDPCSQTVHCTYPFQCHSMTMGTDTFFDVAHQV